MSVVLPSTVEEINCMQNPFLYNQLLHTKQEREEFSNIKAPTFKRLVSIPCPDGVQWSDMPDFDQYLNFNEPNFVEVIKCSNEDRLVPGEDEQRPRSESISSVVSMDDNKSYVYNSLGGVKSFSTVCVDSGSTCISSEHSYVNINPSSVFKDLEAEETFQNLHPLLSQGSELHNSDTTSSISSASPSLISDHLDYSVSSNYSTISQDGFSDMLAHGIGNKRSASTLDTSDHLFMTLNSPKRICESPDPRFSEMRKRNNVASKHSRKTRKEKQKEMETRVADLEKEREDLIKQINYLEIMTNEFRKHISSIMRPIQNV